MYSEKGKTLTLKNDYKFCFHKNLNNKVERWKCIRKQRKAYIKIGKINVLITMILLSVRYLNNFDDI